MPNCELISCNKVFDNSKHKQQRFCSKKRFCSKSCAKIGTRNRHNVLRNSLEEGSLELAACLVKLGCTYKETSKLTGVVPSTIFNYVKRKEE